MALSLKDAETDSLARELVSLTGETLTEAVRTSLRQRLRHERLKRGQPAWDEAAIDAIVARCAKLRCSTTVATTRSSAMTRTRSRADGYRQLRPDSRRSRRVRKARFSAVEREAYPRLVGAPTVIEASIVMLSRFGEKGLTDLLDYIAVTSMEVVALRPEHVDLAVHAFRQFGIRRHPARLNFEDCLSYALAKATGQPLLFKGDDFDKTDVLRISQRR